MNRQNLLVELFVEELPPKVLNKLGQAFATVLAEQLHALGLTPADAVVTPYASPRPSHRWRRRHLTKPLCKNSCRWPWAWTLKGKPRRRC